MPGSRRRERPWVTVDVVVVVPVAGRFEVLLVKRKRPPFEGCWAIPGGFVEPGESLAAAARRVDVDTIALVGSIGPDADRSHR